MTEEEIQSLQYRFSGYQLPKIQLDETGDSYVVLNPHPYYYGQPEYWAHPYYYLQPGNNAQIPDIVEGGSSGTVDQNGESIDGSSQMIRTNQNLFVLTKINN